METREALSTSIDAWRKTKHPRWAQLAEWAAARALAGEPERPVVGAGGKKADAEAWDALLAKDDPLDLARLFAALGTAKSPVAAERVAAIARRDDPRVVSGLLALLERPPWRAKTAMGFFRAIVTALERSRDVRAREGLASLADRYKGIIETSVGDDLIVLFRRTVEKLGDVAPKPLTAAEEKKLAAAEAHFETERAAATRQRAEKKDQGRSDEELLAAIYAAPDDDAPRLVFADALTERGDVRGELISLQIRRARGEASPELIARERALTSDAKQRAAWAMPLSAGGECELARGFPVAVHLRERTAKSIVASPAWATVQRVTGFDVLSVKLTKTLLEPPVMRHVRSVSNLTEAQLDAAAPLAPQWRRLGLRFIPRPEALARFPSIRALALQEHQLYERDGQPRTFPEDPLAGCPQLEELEIAFAPARHARFFAPVKSLRSLEVSAWLADWPLEPDAFAALTRLERLFVTPVTPALVRGLPLTWLGTQQLTPDELAPVLAEVPSLTHFELRSSLRPAWFAPLLAGLRGSRVETFSYGGLTALGACRDGATLEVRGYVPDAKLTEVARTLAPGAVARVVRRPPGENPALGVSPAPGEEALAALRAAFAPTGASIEVAWW